jgi:hypothetical protein
VDRKLFFVRVRLGGYVLLREEEGKGPNAALTRQPFSSGAHFRSLLVNLFVALFDAESHLLPVFQEELLKLNDLSAPDSPFGN